MATTQPGRPGSAPRTQPEYVTNADGTTSIYNVDGTVTTAQPDANGNLVPLKTIRSNPDGSTTGTFYDASGAPSTSMTFAPGVYPDPSVSHATSRTDLGGPDAGRVVTFDGNGNVLDIQKADGTHITKEQNDAAQTGGFGGITSWTEAAKTGARSLKEASEQLNPIGTPGVDQNAVNGRIFGGAGSTDPVFTSDTAGSILAAIAKLYGLGGILGGSGSGGSGGAGGAGTSLSGATAGLASDVAAARDLRSKFGAAYDSATPGVAPVITAAQAKDPTLATVLAQLPITQATAGQVGAIPQVVAPRIGAAPTVQAGTATAGLATPASSINVALAKAAQAQASQLDPTQQAEWRDQQKTLAGYLNDAILGNAPSVAELQLREAEQRQEANQLGLAAKASGGGNVALALRTAANNIGRLNQGASADAALLRAQEIAAARGQLGDVLGTARTGDINLADRNATLATGVSQTNAGLATDVSKLNASNQTDASKTLAQLLTQANIANAGNQTQASVATAGNQTQASAATASNITQLMAKQAELEYQASHDNAGNALSAQETQAKLATDVSLAAALAKNTADLQTQRLNEEASATNANNSTSTNINNAKFINDAAASNATNTLTQRQLDEKTKQDAAANTLAAGTQTIQGGSAAADAAAKVEAAQRQGLAALGTGLATLFKGSSSGSTTSGAQPSGGGAQEYIDRNGNGTTSDDHSSPPTDDDTTSDRRAKTDVSDGEAAAQSILDAMNPKSFRYKDGVRGPGVSPGKKTGVMAQDLERSPAGKSLVKDTPGGKVIDGAGSTGTLMAMLATLNKRLDRVEGRHAA